MLILCHVPKLEPVIVMKMCNREARKQYPYAKIFMSYHFHEHQFYPSSPSDLLNNIIPSNLGDLGKSIKICKLQVVVGRAITSLPRDGVPHGKDKKSQRGHAGDLKVLGHHGNYSRRF